jgi:hypothetical protein
LIIVNSFPTIVTQFSTIMAQPQPKNVQQAQSLENILFSTGRVLKTDSDNNITVDIESQILIAGLATHVPSPLLGQRVLVMLGANVLPLITAAYPLDNRVTSNANDESIDSLSSSSSDVMSFDPATGALNIHAKQLNLQGMSSIEIRCGESVLRFNAQGEVFMLAEAITQSAIGQYQIEGASIDLN